MIARHSGNTMREWYYNLGIGDEIPRPRNDFKCPFVYACSERGLDSLHKYSEQKRSEYITRLMDNANLKNVS